MSDDSINEQQRWQAWSRAKRRIDRAERDGRSDTHECTGPAGKFDPRYCPRISEQLDRLMGVKRMEEQQ